MMTQKGYGIYVVMVVDYRILRFNPVQAADAPIMSVAPATAGLRPAVDLKIAPLIPAAANPPAKSCSPLRESIVELIALYIKASTPKLFPKKLPRLVTEFNTLLRRSLAEEVLPRLRRIPSCTPYRPPIARPLK